MGPELGGIANPVVYAVLIVLQTPLQSLEQALASFGEAWLRRVQKLLGSLRKRQVV